MISKNYETLMTRIFEGRLKVNYGQAYVESSEHRGVGLEESFCGQINGLCGAAYPGSLFLITGLHTGYVGFTLDVLDTPPSLDDVWEEIVEVSFKPKLRKIIMFNWDGEKVCDIPLLPKTYRVRYCARNMELGSEVDSIVEEEPVDFYALMFWQGDLAPDVVVKQTSPVAAGWHNWARTLKF